MDSNSNNSSYLDRFLTLKCCGDVLNAVAPINKGEKEISEAMGMIKAIKPHVMAHKMEYTLVDLCAGNALTSILAVHLLPIKRAIAINIKPHNRHHDMVTRFKYITADINRPNILDIIQKEVNFNNKYLTDMREAEKVIIVSTHPCKELANRIIGIFNCLPNADYLFLMPCCVGKIGNEYKFLLNNEDLRKKIGMYNIWSLDLAHRINGILKIDKHITSPCNAVISTKKQKNLIKNQGFEWTKTFSEFNST